MTPGRMPLTLYHGDTYRWQFSLWLDTAKTTPADLTGATANSQIRDRPGGTLIVALVCTITLPNKIDVVLSATDSAKLPGSGAWDLQVTYASGDVATVLAGPVNTTVDVTTTTVTALPFARVLP
jgi:hypothetical protein